MSGLRFYRHWIACALLVPAAAGAHHSRTQYDGSEVQEIQGELIAARSTMDSAEVERRNPNYVGGDIIGGVQDLRQLYTRPVARPVPYSTPVPGLFICSSSTPPGGGVHGMCGYWAARAALRRGGGS